MCAVVEERSTTNFIRPTLTMLGNFSQGKLCLEGDQGITSFIRTLVNRELQSYLTHLFRNVNDRLVINTRGRSRNQQSCARIQHVQLANRWIQLFKIEKWFAHAHKHDLHTFHLRSINSLIGKEVLRLRNNLVRCQGANETISGSTKATPNWATALRRATHNSSGFEGR